MHGIGPRDADQRPDSMSFATYHVAQLTGPSRRTQSRIRNIGHVDAWVQRARGGAEPHRSTASRPSSTGRVPLHARGAWDRECPAPPTASAPPTWTGSANYAASNPTTPSSGAPAAKRPERCNPATLFKLYAPRNVIAGGGFFVEARQLPVSRAWMEEVDPSRGSCPQRRRALTDRRSPAALVADRKVLRPIRAQPAPATCRGADAHESRQQRLSSRDRP